MEYSLPTKMMLLRSSISRRPTEPSIFTVVAVMVENAQCVSINMMPIRNSEKLEFKFRIRRNSASKLIEVGLIFDQTNRMNSLKNKT
jgi:hypothetical protein